MMKKPVIGITCDYEYNDAAIKSNNIADKALKWHVLSENYSLAIEKAGGIPLLLPVCHQEENYLELIELVDGVLITGGNDIDPLLFGEVDKGKCGRINPARDSQEIAIVKRIIERTNKPLLCICRGHQVLNVALGGTLYQDLEEGCQTIEHMKSNYPMNLPSHHALIDRDSKLFNIFTNDKIGVNSFHHQAVKELGHNLKVTAKSDDGVIEAIEYNDGRFIIGIQWHPEKMYDSLQQQLIFEAFIAACQK